jgi:hypothetical protein
MLMPTRTWDNGSKYRYGFNGQEVSNEIHENSYTAEFWEYDSRSGRRWNTDPVSTPWESPYATNKNNPIWYNDPNGDCPDCKNGQYQIEKGDNFSKLEDKWGLEQGYLQSLNPGLDPHKLKVGQVINTEPDIPVNQPSTQLVSKTINVTSTTKRVSNTVAVPLTLGAGVIADDASVIGVADDPLLIPIALWATAALIYDYTHSGTTTTTIPFTITIPEPKPFYYVTYTKINPSTGRVYVGRSSGYGTPAQIVTSRDIGHHMDKEGYGKAIVSTFVPATLPGGYATRAIDPSYWSIRGSEQLQIQGYRALGISGNTYNGISPKNGNLQKYLNAARNVLKPK